jgi:hypothetical protein
MRPIIAVHKTPLLRAISSLRRHVSELPALALRKAFEQRLAVCSERRYTLYGGAPIQETL